MVMPSMATLMAKKAKAYHEITDRTRVWTIWNTRIENVIRNTPDRCRGEHVRDVDNVTDRAG